MTVLLLLWILAQEEEPARRVKPLVEQVAGDDIEAADRALKALVELGPRALPALEAERAAADGDLRLRLEEVIRKIRRAEKLASLAGEPTLVTLELRDRPIQEVLAALAKASGQPIDPSAAPPRTLTISLDREPFWSALEKVCKAHGKMRWHLTRDFSIGLEAESWVDRPRIARGDLLVYVPNYYRWAFTATGEFIVECRVASTRGRRPSFASFRIDELEDDQGTRLETPVQGGFAETSLGSEASLDRPGLQLELDLPIRRFLPHEKAAKLLRLKGEAQVSYVLSTELWGGVPLEDVSKWRSAKEGVSFAITAVRWNEAQPSVSALFKGTLRFPATSWSFALLNPEGKSFPAFLRKEEAIEIDLGSSRVIAEWKLPKAFKATRLEVRIPDDVETIRVPFDFKDLPLPAPP